MLFTKTLHNGLQTTGFTYNERGWLKNSNSSEFDVSLSYNSGMKPQYNGNISGQSYTNGNSNSFAYEYDKMNRLVRANAEDNLGEIISYDAGGNITSLTRDGFGTNSYTRYLGNKLTNITGFINSSYSYDVNGNLKVDGHRGITNISYNHLNLPNSIMGTTNIVYTYDANGRKLRKVGASGTVDYVNGIQYTNGSIDFIQTDEGVALNNAGTYTYNYNLKDHLGNVRTTFDIYNGTVRVLQRDNYFAFGLRKSGINGNGLVSLNNKYLYNGKELQDELEQYDYGARFYDPVIGRWNVVDPLAEKDRKTSPYVYALNNPVRFIDPDGMQAEDPQKRVNVTVTATEDKNHKLHVTQTTTTTTVVQTETGSITTKSVMSSTNVISNSNTEATVYGDVTTKTSVTTVDGDKVSTEDKGTTIANRSDAKGDLAPLNSISKGLERFRNEHGMQFNSYVNDKGSTGLAFSVGGAGAPFGGAAGLTGLATKIGGWAPSIVRLFGFAGIPTSVSPGLASKIILPLSGALSNTKTVFVSSNGRVISNMLPNK